MPGEGIPSPGYHYVFFFHGELMVEYTFIREDLSPGNTKDDEFYFMVAATKPKGRVDISHASLPDKVFFFFTKDRTFELILNTHSPLVVSKIEREAKLFPFGTNFNAAVELVLNRFEFHHLVGWDHHILLKRKERVGNKEPILPSVEKLTHISRS